MNHVHDVTCDICHVTAIVGTRRKCGICPDFDVCEKCYPDVSTWHPGHFWLEIDRPTRSVWDDTFVGAVQGRTEHTGIQCDGCNAGPLVDVRYKCIHPDCPDYDLCAACEALPIRVHPISHPFVKMRLPRASYQGLGDVFNAVHSPQHFVQSTVNDSHKDHRIQELTAEVAKLKALLSAKSNAQGPNRPASVRPVPPVPTVVRPAQQTDPDPGPPPAYTLPTDNNNDDDDDFPAGLPDLPPPPRSRRLAPDPPARNGAHPRSPSGRDRTARLPDCAIPGCTSPVFQQGAKYCNRNHQHQAVVDGLEPACILCGKFPKAVAQFCGQNCLNSAYNKAPMLIALQTSDPKWEELHGQFMNSWRHPESDSKSRPTLVHIYKIVLRKNLMDAYTAYQNQIETQGRFKAQGHSAGNERRRWHGTRRACTIGDDPDDAVPCQQTACALCCILRTSFQVAVTGSAPGRTISFSRFGTGIYASSTSSKSHDYQSNLVDSPYKAIMLTHVIVGRGAKLTADDEELTAPPAGFHSVLGETGDSLNYDEVVVYNDDAIRPAWLFIYQ